MSKFSLFTQAGMILIAVIIGVMYIKPTYSNIKATQSTTTLYEEEADKVKDVDLMLEKKIGIIDSVSTTDADALHRYMPDTIDEVEVMKDLQSIFTALDLPLTSIAAGGSTEGTSSAAPTEEGAAPGTDQRLVAHSFSLSSTMKYDEVKPMLKALEVNNYLFEVQKMSLTPAEEGNDVTVALTLNVYSRATILPPAPEEESVNEELE